MWHFFRVTFRERAQIFVKKATIYEKDITQFVFLSPTQIKYQELKKKCDMKKYFVFCVTFTTVQVKQRLTTWKDDQINTFVEN